MARHQGNHYGYTKAVENALDKINVNQPIDALKSQVSDLQNIARSGMQNGTPIRASDLARDNSVLGNQRALKMWNEIFN